MNKNNLLIIACVLGVLVAGCKFLATSVESRKGELLNLKVDDSKKSTQAKLKAKVAVIVLDNDGKISVNDFMFADKNAKNVDEIATLIRIIYGDNIGKAEIIDYKTKTLIADYSYDTSILGKPKDKETAKLRDGMVREEIYNYLKGLPIE